MAEVHAGAAERQIFAEFQSWRAGHGEPAITPAMLEQYSAKLVGQAMSPAEVKLRLAVIRKLLPALWV
jgi:hypothetical protein